MLWVVERARNYSVRVSCITVFSIRYVLVGTFCMDCEFYTIAFTATIATKFVLLFPTVTIAYFMAISESCIHTHKCRHRH